MLKLFLHLAVVLVAVLAAGFAVIALYEKFEALKIIPITLANLKRGAKFKVTGSERIFKSHGINPNFKKDGNEIVFLNKSHSSYVPLRAVEEVLHN